MEEPPDDTKDENPPHDSPQRPRIPLHIVAGIIVGLGVAFFLVRWYFADPSPLLTRELLREAQSRWKAAAIHDYDVEVEVKSRQVETYAVEVRNDVPQQAWRNGQPLKQVRVFDTWSVPGMFATLSDDLDRCAPASQAKGEGLQLMLRCTFDPKTGAPMRYRRIEWGKDLDISWQITKLEYK